MNFRKWFEAGFRDLIPIIPPEGELNPFSKVKPEQRGKVPGRKRPDGTWTGMKAWIEHPTSRPDCDVWNGWYDGPRSIGLRAASFPAVDIDVDEPALAEVIRNCAWDVLGTAPVRSREGTSKCLLLYRTEAPFRRLRLWFTYEGTPHLIEVLGAGNQFLVAGEHKAGMEYQWSEKPTADALMRIDAEGASEFLVAVQEALEAKGCTDFKVEGEARASVERAVVLQPSLEAPDVATVAALLKGMPNTEEHFPSRDDYLKVGYAVKASLPHDEAAALDLWLAWCEPYPTFDAEVATADWSRLQPPFAIGYDWLREQARSLGAPLAEEEFADICEPPPLPTLPEEERLEGVVSYSDAWVSDLFLHEYGNRVRYNERLGGWLWWDGHRWAADAGGTVSAWVARSCRRAGRHALDHMEKGAAVAKDCASNNKRKAVQSYASIDPRVNVPIEAFDADPWALNTPEGIVDLRTGKLAPSDSGRLFTRCTAVAPSVSPTPRWNAFLLEAANGDAEMVSYLKRLAGYALTGSTREHVLAFLWGPGGNGKGVFLNTLVRVLGSYAAVAAMDTFTSSRFDRHPAELAALVGARLVTAQETQEDRSWDEAKVKSITGGDPITARFMRQDFFTYLPQFKLLFAGNHRPHIKNLDDAMRRRFHLVPFTARPPFPDQVLAERLQVEWAGILQWAVEGCLEWQRDGLHPPAAVVEATQNYFIDEDPLGRWMTERLLVGVEEGTGVETTVLFADWRLWCLQQNERPGTARDFAQALFAKGMDKWRHPKTRHRGVAGVLLRDEASASLGALPPPDLGGAAFIH